MIWGQTPSVLTQDFGTVLSEHELGDAVTVRYQRGNEVREVTVTLKELRN